MLKNAVLYTENQGIFVFRDHKFNNDIFQYNWAPDGTINDPNATNPTAFPLATTPYSVTVTSISADTCAVQSKVLVTVPERIFVDASDDVTMMMILQVSLSLTKRELLSEDVDNKI